MVAGGVKEEQAERVGKSEGEEPNPTQPSPAIEGAPKNRGGS